VFNAGIDPNHVPAESAFTVGGVNPVGVAVGTGNYTNRVILTMANVVAAHPTDIVVAYTSPGGDTALRHMDNGPVVASFDGFTPHTIPGATNNHFPGLSSFVGGSAVVTNYGNEIHVSFATAVQTTPAPGGNITGFSVNSSVKGNITVANAAVREAPNNNTVILTMPSTLLHGEVVTVSYSGGNLVGVPAPNLPVPAFDNAAVTNGLAAPAAPIVLSAAVNGNKLRISFSQGLRAGTNVSPTHFVVNADGSPITVTTVEVGETNATDVLLTLATPTSFGQTVTVNYTSPGDANNIFNAHSATVAVATFAGQAVTNNSLAAPALPGPTDVSMAMGIGTLAGGKTATIARANKSAAPFVGFSAGTLDTTGIEYITAGGADRMQSIIDAGGVLIPFQFSQNGPYALADVIRTVLGVEIKDSQGNVVKGLNAPAALFTYDGANNFWIEGFTGAAVGRETGIPSGELGLVFAGFEGGTYTVTLTLYHLTKMASKTCTHTNPAECLVGNNTGDCWSPDWIVQSDHTVPTAHSTILATETVTIHIGHTVTFDLDGGTRTGGGQLTQIITHNGAATAPTVTRSNHTFANWDVAFNNVTSDITVTAQWTATQQGSGLTPPFPPFTPPPSTPATGTGTGQQPQAPPLPPLPPPTIYVDGNQLDAGAVTTTHNSTTVVISQEFLDSHMQNAGDSLTISIPATGTANTQMAMQNMQDMAARDMTLTIQVDNVQFEIHAAAIDTASIMESLGAVDASDVTVTTTIITNVDSAQQQVIYNALTESGLEMVLPPKQFSITATYNNQAVEVTTFNRFVGRTVEITAEQAARATTAMVIEPDGTTRHVPTKIFEQDGKYFATLNSLTNSIYVLVYSESDFTDARDKWYEATVNEMGRRKIVYGIGNDLFDGDRDITRAEFATIIIRALGLPLNSGNVSAFSDVLASAWYHGTVGKAYEQGLVFGVGGGRYEPGRPITRQEAMVILHRMAILADFEGSMGSLHMYIDADMISDWAIEAARWSVGSGLFIGSDGELRPLDNITRAETTAIVLRLLQKAELIDARTQVDLGLPTSVDAAPMAILPRKEDEEGDLYFKSEEEEDEEEGEDEEDKDDDDNTDDSIDDTANEDLSDKTTDDADPPLTQYEIIMQEIQESQDSFQKLMAKHGFNDDADPPLTQYELAMQELQQSQESFKNLMAKHGFFV
jgi:uncharacterized repeat protein (TIGR02059 family)